MFTPDSVSADVAEFCVIPVTFVPMTAEMVVVPVPVPELVMVPIILTEPVEIVIAPQEELPTVYVVTFPVPVIPPLNIVP